MTSSWLDTSTWQVILLLPISIGLTFLVMFIAGNIRPIRAQIKTLLASSGYFLLAGMTVLIGCWELRAPDAFALPRLGWTVLLFSCIGVALIGAATTSLMALPARS